jgi:lipopolysaccharide assembly outer membrane protein LptD (OstA)
LHAKSFYTIGLLIFFTVAPLFAQNAAETATKTPKDSLGTSTAASDKKKEPMLLDKVRYDAKDSIIIDKKNNKLYLYNEAEMEYEDILLQSGLIVLDYKNNEVYAGRIVIDTAGTLAQYPYFKQGTNEVSPDSIRFNFTTQKALIWNSKSAEAGMNVFAGYYQNNSTRLCILFAKC